MSECDWVAWHDAYDEPGSRLSGRLAAVQAQVRLALDDAPAGPLRVLSLVAGQGRDWLSEPGAGFGVGAHRSTRDPRPRPAGMSLFTFLG